MFEFFTTLTLSSPYVIFTNQKKNTHSRSQAQSQTKMSSKGSKRRKWDHNLSSCLYVENLEKYGCNEIVQPPCRDVDARATACAQTLSRDLTSRGSSPRETQIQY